MATIESTINVRAPSYYLAATERRCWRCGVDTRIHAFVLPPGHEFLLGDDDDAETPDAWEVADEPSLLSHLSFLIPAVATRIRARTQSYQLRFSRSAASHYWMNVCQHCYAVLGDFDTLDEPGEGFLAFTPEQAARIALTRIHQPFGASCGSWSVGIELFEYMQVN